MAKTKKPAPKSGEEEVQEAAGSRKKLLMLAVPLLAVVAGWYFLMGPAAAGDAEPEAVKRPEAGEVLSLEPITMNLADGRLLKVGLALQVVAEPSSGEEVTGAVALDEAIAYLGGRTYDELVAPQARQAAKQELSKRVAARYHDDVIEVYFTEFVMQ
jgi:flagellar FliL protein